jgi:hypothetical protein
MPMIDVMPRAVDYPGALGVKPFNYHLPIGEVMLAFDTDIDTVPWNGPYLRADPGKVEHYRQELRRAVDIKRVGVCWSSGIRTHETWLQTYGLRKSMQFDALEPVMAAIYNNDGTAINLQVGPERVQHGLSIEDCLPENPDWDDTAALVANLDLVITVDTAVAHLAGAMGKPVWLMMHPGGSWHWMVERPGSPWNEKSPWYPSVRIFRQKTPGDWSDVVDTVRKELERWQPQT